MILAKLLLMLLLCYTEAHPFARENPDKDKCRGLEAKECKEVIECIKDIKVKSAEKENKQISRDKLEDTVVLDDVVLNIEQCKVILSLYTEERKELFHGKRKIVDFLTLPYRQWKFPITYMIDNVTQWGITDAYDLQTIRRSFEHWELKTCVRFTEVPYSETLTDHHIEVFKGQGCWSLLGMYTGKQYISIGQYCEWPIGIPIHEIGHSLGLTHEQQRPDRDSYINILYEHVDPEYISQFEIEPQTTTVGLPYDYGSIMHYGSRFFTVDGNRTMETKDPDYQYNIGSRATATFMDVTSINRAYGCLDPNSENFPSACHSPEATCENGGYPNPYYDCKVCVCPDGLGGDCTVAAEGSVGCSPYSSNIDVTSMDEQCLYSPNYDVEPFRYESGSHCSWLLKAPVGRTITFYFDLTNGFGVRPGEETCYHWVEIKFKGNITEPGARFCGSYLYNFNQDSVHTSADNLVLIDFRSDIPLLASSHQRGFKLCYKLTDSGVIETTPEVTTEMVTSLAPETTPVVVEQTTEAKEKSCLRCSTKDHAECMETGKIKKCPAGYEGCYLAHARKKSGKLVRVTAGCIEKCYHVGYVADEDLLTMYCCTEPDCNIL